MKRITLWILLPLTILSCKDHPTESTPIHFNGRIVFGAITAEGNGFIYSDVMIVDDKSTPRKISSAASCFSRRPHITRDGTKIAFSSCAQRPDNIFIVNTDGTGLRNITNDLAIEEFPMWSSDGKFLAFVSFRDGFRDLFLLNDVTAEVVKVTQSDSSYWSGSWAEDNSKLIYYGAAGIFANQGDIYSFDLQSRTRRRLTTGAGLKLYPTLTPDGTLIAYQRDAKLHFLSSDGASDIRVVNAPDSVADPMDWSSRGDFLIFRGNVNGRRDIYKINRDGSGLTNLTNGSLPAYAPVLSPDDMQIAYVANTGTLNKIYLMNIDGTNTRTLTNLNQSEFTPSWGN